jgi:adenylosuccinate synthase
MSQQRRETIRMSNIVLVGGQWGDEGKGKIIDELSETADVVVRYQGGNNAGHTVRIGEQKFVLHLLPSGILHSGKVCVIGNGLVIDPIALCGEIDELQKQGIDVGGRLYVSDRAHVVFPFHRAVDECREQAATGVRKIGTTKRGIGPCYGDKAARVGLRMADMIDPSFRELLAARIEEQNRILTAMGGEAMDAEAVIAMYIGAATRLSQYVADTVLVLNRAVREGRSILFEGAQGTMLDIDFGTYPYVTSSNATSGGASTGTGVAPHRVDCVLGVVKAYTTRVGEGPFPTELKDEVGATLGREGKEFGATTGRPRRCGWYDAVVARYAAMVNGFDYLAVTKLDVMDSLKTVKICTAYEYDGKTLEGIPANIRILAACRPVYEEMPGWQTSTRQARRFEDLPDAAQNYVRRLCELTGVKLGMLSVGPERGDTMRIAL